MGNDVTASSSGGDGSVSALSVSIDTARREVLSLTQPVDGLERVALDQAAGRIVQGDVLSPARLPIFDHSAVDGYALGSIAPLSAQFVVGRRAAGAGPDAAVLQPGDAMRIFTGAPVPPGAEGVIMQEHVDRVGDRLTILKPCTPGANIRRSGEDVGVGERLVPSGAVLDARHVAILAAAGLSTVTVARKVCVAVLSTGNELREAGTAIPAGMIYDSNRQMLKALLADASIDLRDFGILPDDPGHIAATLQEAGRDHDLVVSTGGVSKGEEDHVRSALAACGGTVRFLHMQVKPGKPVTIGRLGGAIFIGLPGNPVAALVDFLLLVRPVIQSLAGTAVAPWRPQAAKAGFDWARRTGRTEFFPVAIVGQDDNGLPILEKLGKGGSARLRPLISADGLGQVAAETARIVPAADLSWYPFTTAFPLHGATR